jgi:PAS domain S-box-containing protein
VLQTAYPAAMQILSGRFRRNRSGGAESAPWLGLKDVPPSPLTGKRLLLAVDSLLEGRAMRVAVRYALAPICILLVTLFYLSPAGPSLNLPSLFLIGVLAAAWFGGAGPGFVSAVMATLALPHLAVANHQLLGGVLDLPLFIGFSAEGLVVGWGSSRRARLLRDQERYARAMDASDDGFWDWNLADDTVYTSPRLLEIFGFAPGTTFAGHDDFATQLPFQSEERPLLTRALAEHFAGRTAHYDLEARFIRRGETRWVQLAGLAARDSHGAVVRWTGTVRDVTERKRSEEALRESEERYELAMAASESGYWDWHIPTDRFFGSRRAHELTGIPAETQWVNRRDYRARMSMQPEDFERWEAAREALFAGTGERLAMEVRYIVRGEIRWHMLQAICKRDDAGKVIRWAGSTTDITERKGAEEGLKTVEQKLRQAQRVEAMGALAGGIAHDFNNILGAILGYGEMALRDAPEGSRLARDVGSIMIAGERGRALVERVSAFSRSAVSERVPVHVERVVEEALDLVSAKLLPSLTVHADLHAGGAAVLGDATQVHQVVANLATNAIQAMPAGGTLRVELGVERVDAPRASKIGEFSTGDYVVLTVADTGAGIAAEILDRIFDPFFTTKEVGTGTGLGLSLVHGIVTELGGAIDVTSSLGIGSTFTVFLPRSGDAAEHSDQEGAPLPGGIGQCVLIVDDEEPLVELASRTLADLGYVPIGFTSSTAALAAFRADPGRFDALITDERMPEMSGSTLIQEVRGLRSSIPIVLMSGYLAATAGKARESGLLDMVGVASAAALASGADEVLQKPLSARDLAASLARVLPP